MKKDLLGKVFKEGDSVAYIGFDNKIHIGKAVKSNNGLILELPNNVGISKLGKSCLIIN